MSSSKKDLDMLKNHEKNLLPNTPEKKLLKKVLMVFSKPVLDGVKKPWFPTENKYCLLPLFLCSYPINKCLQEEIPSLIDPGQYLAIDQSPHSD